MGDGDWLNEREQRAWRGFIELANFRDQFGRELQAETGLSGADYAILVSLSEAADGRMRAIELRKAINWEKSRLTQHLNRMASRGLVTREPCLTDNRGIQVSLTQAGREAIEAAAPRHVGHVRRWFIDALTPDQLDTFADLTKVVLDHIAAQDHTAQADSD
ncbi:MarR family winged helix-turn-helix transcriptional regulator [Lentzea nigeriaca]|uniref:MarR family winged helix-turn-helix transcriptional regulator n=1 Tax=Lentzea nigeriaca TaxID=1128665 RepID=UPI00195CBFE1|nr:MarR family transcriptional regulator [Lentzea nigeriaca]MBM7863600.1 DNA-binding MarR family transcriptional regulator [Lentzea nigeriaca]